MEEAFFGALLTLLSPIHLVFLSFGVFLGLVVGILPGLGGTAGLALVLPFIFGMEPSHALAMMIGLQSVTATSDTFPSVLMGIPGTSSAQATVVDGFPLSKKGEAARALAAAFSASLFGGLFGAFVLTFAIFYAEPIIMAMGFGEQLMLIVLALTMVGMLTGTHPLKGLAACAIGLIIGAFGPAPVTGGERLTFGTDYLIDPIKIVIVGLAMFAVPEIIDLLRRRVTISGKRHTRRGMAARRPRHDQALVDRTALLDNRMHRRRASRSRRIGRRLDRLWPCRSDQQEQGDLRERRYPWRDRAGSCQQRQGRRCPRSDNSVRNSGIRQHGAAPWRICPDRHRAGHSRDQGRARPRLPDDLVGRSRQHLRRRRLPPIGTANRQADDDTLCADRAVHVRADLLRCLPSHRQWAIS
jgi:hypothetical protein